VVTSGQKRSKPAWASLEVPKAPPPEAPTHLLARPLPGEIALAWEGPAASGTRYDVYRAAAGSASFAKLNKEPLPRLSYADLNAEPGVKYAYVVRALDRRDQASPPSAPAEAAPLPEVKEPVFVALQGREERGEGRGERGQSRRCQLHGGAKIAGGVLDLGDAGFATFAAQPEFSLQKALSIECWVRMDKEGQMPVVLCCGGYMQSGWFLQRYGGGWRWHLAPTSCDGGRPVVGRWTHLVGTFNGTQACLYQDGRLAAKADCFPNRAPCDGPLVVGQYSRQSPSYQVHGQIAGVKIYARALRAEEVAASFKAGREK